jgi:quercetin 2,3-dioxygenase
MISVHRADDRFRTRQPGITTLHCFSSGAHYEPANTNFGALVACDEHVVAPGAGFARHTHRGVEIISWILEGTLRHEDGSGRDETVTAGTVQYQAAASGIEHTETNASATAPLRFIQMVLLADGGLPRYLLSAPPLSATAGEFAVHATGTLHTTGLVHLYVARGRYELNGVQLGEGDSVRCDEPLTVGGDGELLVWSGIR